MYLVAKEHKLYLRVCTIKCHSLVKALLHRVLLYVVVWAEPEGEVAAVVGGHLDAGVDHLA